MQEGALQTGCRPTTTGSSPASMAELMAAVDMHTHALILTWMLHSKKLNHYHQLPADMRRRLVVLYARCWKLPSRACKRTEATTCLGSSTAATAPMVLCSEAGILSVSLSVRERQPFATGLEHAVQSGSSAALGPHKDPATEEP